MKEEKPFKFEMTEIESQRARDFLEKHRKCPSRVMEKFAVKFIPTMMGHIVYIHCMACGETEEITEVEKF